MNITNEFTNRARARADEESGWVRMGSAKRRELGVERNGRVVIRKVHVEEFEVEVHQSRNDEVEQVVMIGSMARPTNTTDTVEVITAEQVAEELDEEEDDEELPEDPDMDEAVDPDGGYDDD